MPRYKRFQTLISVATQDDHAICQAALGPTETAPLNGQRPLLWVMDEAGHRKEGVHSVFVHCQRGGSLGKVVNRQVTVDGWVVTVRQSLTIDFELDMVKVRAQHAAGYNHCKVPVQLELRTESNLFYHTRS